MAVRADGHGRPGATARPRRVPHRRRYRQPQLDQRIADFRLALGPRNHESRDDNAGPDGRLIVNDFRFVSRVLASADIGFGEGFMAGEWDTPDLSAPARGLHRQLR